ncbi:EF-hand domain-containing protein [Candidatus Poseidoniaceae archaeon]|nr:EF-hand domain-containing protein [Candidatus Poseidoniaceae archaeon]
MAGTGDGNMNVDEILKKLSSALAEKQLSVAGLFSQLDTDNDGRINGPELHKGIKILVGDFLSPGQVSSIIQSVDSNSDNRIDMYELRIALERVN